MHEIDIQIKQDEKTVNDTVKNLELISNTNIVTKEE